MHFISEPRYNAKTQGDDWYYRIKESFRDRTGRARCRIMLNVGFMDEPHRPEDIRDIGKCLNHLHRHQGETDMFGSPLLNCNAFVRLRLCSEPNKDAEMIYEQLRYRKMPFRKIKIE